MCETMTNIPVPMEETSSYILTEDMIDAAMTEQFTFEDGCESDDEQSSQEYVEIQCSSNDDTSDKDFNETPVSSSNQTLANGSEALCETNNVVVIDTGFGQSELNVESERGDDVVEKNKIDEIVLPIDTGPTSTNGPSSCDKIVDCQDEIPNDIHHDVKHNELPTLVEMLNENPPSREEGASQFVESIDLCNSDSDELSMDDATGGEQIDNELQSVMETNLMAEFGITFGEKPSNIEQAEATEPTMPKISVKNIGHISANDFAKIPTNSLDLPHVNVEKRRSVMVGSNSPGISIASKDVSSSIQLNKIAVPNQTFVNNQGKRMKCVYVRPPSKLPMNVKKDINQPVYTKKNINQPVHTNININQPVLTNKNIKYVLAPSLKNGALQLAPASVETLKKRVPLVQKKPGGSRQLLIAPKLMKGPDLLKGSPTIHRFDKDQNNDTLVKSLLFHSLKNPYVPSELYTAQITYGCADCNDRFILESSLKHHLARRTIVIRYWCRLCKAELQFFNRCVFLSHLRGHNISRKTIDTACINFSPISEETADAGLVSTYFNEPPGILPKEDRILDSDALDPLKKGPGGLRRGPGSKVLREWPLTSSSNACSNITTTLTGAKGSNNVKGRPVQSRSVGTSTSSTVAPITASLLLSSKPNSVQKQNEEQPLKVTSPVENNTSFYNRTTGGNSTNGNLINIPPNVVCEMMTQENGDVMDDNVDEVVDAESVPIHNTSLAYQGSPTVVEKKSKNVSKKPKTSQQNNSSATSSVKRHCFECNVTCLNITKHLNGTSRPLNPQLACEVCQLILPTRCALKIHLRIHMRIPPFKCPDCGKDFATSDELHAHLKFSCGHLAKCMRFMCIACKTHFPSTVALSNHISAQHSRDIYKCTACPVAFFNKSSLTKHLLSHPQNSAIGMDYKQCSICPKKVVPMEKFMDHVHEHIKNRAIMIYGYKCPMCSVIFANKMPFIIHQIKEKSEMEGKPDPALKHSQKQSRKKSRSETISRDPGSDLEDEPEIVSKYPLPLNGNAEEKDPLSLDDWECAQGQTVDEKKEELCIVCKKNYVVLLPDIDLNEQSLCCRQCVRPLDELADKRSDHFGKTRQRILSGTKIHKPSLNKRRSSNTSVKNETENGLGDFTESSPPKKKNKKKSAVTSWDIFDPSDPTQIQGQVINSKSPNELTCSKCDFADKDHEVFLEHIRIHRTDPNTFQCLECGLCFVVLPSLETHLQMNHGINSIKDYTEKNPYSLPQKTALVMLDENQCRVCRQTFDSVSSLEKHFRTHGMAFMNSLSKSP